MWRHYLCFTRSHKVDKNTVSFPGSHFRTIVVPVPGLVWRHKFNPWAARSSIIINHKLMDTRTGHFKWFYWNRDPLWDSLSQHGRIAASMYSRSEVKDPVIITPWKMWILWTAFDPSLAKDVIGSSGKCQAGRCWEPFHSLCYDPAGDQTHNLPVSRRRKRERELVKDWN